MLASSGLGLFLIIFLRLFPKIDSENRNDRSVWDSSFRHRVRVARSPGASFNYANVGQWSKEFPVCGGKKQSPIDLVLSTYTNRKLSTPLAWNGYSNLPKSMKFRNNGHSVEITGSWNRTSGPSISGGPLTDKYVFHQVHFHWGPTNSVGSEHTFNGDRYPLEMHMVFYKEKYGSVAAAMKKPDGLTVVGILFKIGNENPGIAKIHKYFKIINKPNTEKDIAAFPLSLLVPAFPGKYISYEGSLTTPPCNEVVTWIIQPPGMTVSQAQIRAFRKIELAHHDSRNYRPTMPLNSRPVYLNDC